MNTFRLAFLPGIVAGVISIFTSWLWMGVIFHPYQQRTPGTWRRESGRSYFRASAIHFFAAIAIAVFYAQIAQHAPEMFDSGLPCAIAFAVTIWAIFSLPMVLEAAIFINLHPLVVLGQLLDWLSTSLLACVLTAWWIRR